MFNGGLVQDVPWGGGNFSAALDNRRSATSNRTATINPQYTPTWSAQYTQPLLRDFKIDATRQQLLVTRINQDVSDIQLQQTTMNTVANVRNAYWDYVFAVQSVDVARQSLLLADELLRNNQTKVEIGTMAPIDVVQAQSQAAQQRQAVVTAEGTRRTAEIALEAAHRQRHGRSAVDSRRSSPSIAPTSGRSRSTCRRPRSVRWRAGPTCCRRGRISRRTTSRCACSTTRSCRRSTCRRDTRRPASAARGSSPSGSGVDRGEIIGVDPGGYLDALDMLFRNRLPTWSMALNISYNLGTSAADASIARARIQQSQIEVQLRQLDLQVTSDVSNAAIQVQNAAERVQAAQAVARSGAAAARRREQQVRRRHVDELSGGAGAARSGDGAEQRAAGGARLSQGGRRLRAGAADRHGRQHHAYFQMRFTGVAVAALVVLSHSLAVVSPKLGAFQRARRTDADEPVTLDVVVTDAKSRPVKNLQPGDLELTDAGEARVVETVQLQAGGGRIIGIFLDEFHVRAGDATIRARAALTHLVDTLLRDGDMVALVKPLDPLHAITFTQDRALIRQVIAAFEGHAGDYTPRTEFERNFMSRDPKTAEATRAQVVSAALQSLAQRLGEQHGRKALIFVSEGFRPRTAPRHHLRGEPQWRGDLPARPAS